MEIEVEISNVKTYRHIRRNTILPTNRKHKKYHTYVYRPLVGKSTMKIHFKFPNKFEQRHMNTGKIIDRVEDHLDRTEPMNIKTTELKALVQLFSV